MGEMAQDDAREETIVAKEREEVTVDARNLVASSSGAETGLEAACRAAQALISRLFELPVERSDVGPIAKLPSSGSSLPRFKPVPKPRGATKWEAFATAKGIQKKKKSRMVWDEAKGTWAPAWGFGRRGDDADEPIIEVTGDDVMRDPRAEKDDAKKERVAKNDRNRRANEKKREPRFSKKKTLLDANAAAAAAAPPVGVPVDLEDPSEKKRGKGGVDGALALAQKSTASLGNFDAPRDGEKRQKERGKKRHFQEVVPKGGGLQGEVHRSMDLLNDLMRPKAKAPKKGHLEVMDTHDAELPVDFKRKKGKVAGGPRHRRQDNDAAPKAKAAAKARPPGANNKARNNRNPSKQPGAAGNKKKKARA